MSDYEKAYKELCRTVSEMFYDAVDDLSYVSSEKKIIRCITVKEIFVKMKEINDKYSLDN